MKKDVKSKIFAFIISFIFANLIWGAQLFCLIKWKELTILLFFEILIFYIIQIVFVYKMMFFKGGFQDFGPYP